MPYGRTDGGPGSWRATLNILAEPDFAPSVRVPGLQDQLRTRQPVPPREGRRGTRQYPLSPKGGLRRSGDGSDAWLAGEQEAPGIRIDPTRPYIQHES